MIKNEMESAYKAGKETAESTIDEIVYGDLVPSWIFDDQDAYEFFQAGRDGYAFPEYVTAWRYGSVPTGGRSHNYRDGVAERGVSVMQIDGGEKIKTLAELHSLNNRPMVRVCGWINPNAIGGDGEPLLLCARELKK